MPLVLIGHTSKLAWSHTVSTAFRFTPFEVNLVPGDPTTYLVDGQPREMEADEVTVQARDGNGDLEERSRTLYSTEYGPMFNAIFGLPLFPWTSTSGYSMGDANASNFRYLNHFFETNLAQSTREYDEVLKRNQGIPWVNSIAADRAGRAYYADISVVPHVTDEKATQCNTALGRATYEALRLPVLNGSLSECDWGEDDDAAEPGIFGPSNLPSLFRDDYVTNSNDSYWLSNPEEPLEGFAPIIGDEGTERTLRTRLGLRIVLDRLDGSDEYDGRRFNLGRLQDAVFNNRQYAGELWRDELAEFCREKPVMVGSEGPVDVREACPILEDWDLRDDLDSEGAILFRRFAGRALEAAGGPYDEPFSESDPVNTPRGLNTDNPDVERAFADSVDELRDQDIPLDAPLRGWQYEERGDDEIPIHGGPGTVGVFNAINVPFVPGEGYPNVPHGSSFVQTVELTKGCPRVRTILTYSQSTNRRSPWFDDQTRMFSKKKWVKMAFCEKDILDDPKLKVTRLRDGRRTSEAEDGSGESSPGEGEEPSEGSGDGNGGGEEGATRVGRGWLGRLGFRRRRRTPARRDGWRRAQALEVAARLRHLLAVLGQPVQQAALDQDLAFLGSEVVGDGELVAGLLHSHGDLIRPFGQLLAHAGQLPRLAHLGAVVVGVVGEGQRQDPLRHQVAAVDAGVGLGEHRLDPQLQRRQRRVLA